jgi:RNase P/RNase MRP subunit p29
MGITVLGSVEIPELAKDSKASISIKVDKEQKTIALFVNGKFLQAWKDENDFVSSGKAIVLNQQSVAKLKISNIRITRWDGRIEDTQSTTKKITSDVVKLANKDVIEGKVVSITNNLLTIQTDYAKLDIPLDRISGINFENPKQDGTAKDIQLVKGFLSDYGSFSFAIEEFSRDKITGSCPGIGKIIFAPSSFRVLQFNAKEGQYLDETQDVFNEDEMFK